MVTVSLFDTKLQPHTHPSFLSSQQSDALSCRERSIWKHHKPFGRLDTRLFGPRRSVSESEVVLTYNVWAGEDPLDPAPQILAYTNR